MPSASSRPRTSFLSVLKVSVARCYLLLAGGNPVRPTSAQSAAASRRHRRGVLDVPSMLTLCASSYHAVKSGVQAQQRQLANRRR